MNIVEINSTNSRLMIKAVLPLTQLRLYIYLLTVLTFLLTYYVLVTTICDEDVE